MKYVAIIAITLYIASKFGMDASDLFDSTVNFLRNAERQISAMAANRGH